MGLLSRVRWLNDSTPPPGPAAAAPSAEPTAEPAPAPPLADAPRADPPRSGPAGASSLRDALHQLYAIRPSQEAFAEQALQLIAKGAGVKTAALLGYEPRGARVQLLAHCGLEPDAVQILGGAGASNAWDIPLRSLRNRRINVIEAAHENPFVPGPLLAISPRRLTIAVLPFFHASAPVGVVVLF